MHTSYFLFVMAMMLVCYALIKGKPKQKTILVDKVQLCNTIMHADFRYILCPAGEKYHFEQLHYVLPKQKEE
jgi:hypothetical protein